MIKKAIIAVVLISAVLFFFRYSLFGYFFRVKIENVLFTLLNQHEHILISDKRTDGSEVLIETLPLDIQNDLRQLFFAAKLIYGPDSRVFLYVSRNHNLEEFEYNSKVPLKVNYAEMDASGMWRESILLSEGISFHYFDSEVLVKDIAKHKSAYKKLNEFVLMENSY